MAGRISRRKLDRMMQASTRASMTEKEWQARMKCVAYHEAAHAVVAYSHGGGDVDGISLVPDLRWMGIAYTRRKVSDAPAVLMAGMLAETKLTGKPFIELLREKQDDADGGAVNDWSDLLETQRQYPDEINVATGIWWARELLDQPENWAAVEALAAALLEKEKLTGKQARRIIEQAQRDVESSEE